MNETGPETVLPAPELIGRALPAIAEGMAAAASAAAAGEPRRIDEAILKATTKTALALPAADAGLRLEDVERTIRPAEWPRVGRVDLVLSRADVPATGRAHAFVELKWGAKDALWNCIWDVAKNALVRRLALADHALVLGGFSDEKEWAHAKYGRLLSSRTWETADFQRFYASEWRHWARPPATGESHRSGPYVLPAAFETTLVERHRFEFDGAPWSLALVAVDALPGEVLALGECGQPARPA